MENVRPSLSCGVMSAMDAGLIGFPAAICQLIMIQAIGYISDKTDIRRIIFVGLVLTTFEMLLKIYFFRSFSVWIYQRKSLEIRRRQLLILPVCGNRQ